MSRDQIQARFIGERNQAYFLSGIQSRFQKSTQVPHIGGVHKNRLIALFNEAGLNLITTHQIKSLAKIEILLGIWSVETMVTAQALGLPTAADTLHSYAEFKDYYTALRSGDFKGLLKSPQSFHAMALAAQQNIVPKFTASTLGERWASLLG